VSERVVVTGGSGRIGRYVVRELRDRYDVVNADLGPGEDDGAFARCDVMDLDSVRSVMQDARAVCHLAGLDYDVQAAGEDFVRVNTVGTWNVLQAAAEAGASKAVLASSSSAYGLFDRAPDWRPRYLPVDEAHPYRPYEGYSLSKLVVEEMGRTWSRSHGLSVICMQPLHVAGPESAELYRAHLAAAPADWLHTYVAVQDVARAFSLAVDLIGRPFDTFLLGAADTPLDEPTLDWYARALGPVPELRNPWLYRDNPRASLFSTAKARDVLGWEPRVTRKELGL
jgi:nucleoside-diphosphate-sugar epimerase